MRQDINQLDILIGKRVRYFRKKMGLGLKALAYALNISIPQLQKYEQGQNKISASMLYAIANVFEVSIENLFCGHNMHDTDKNFLNILLLEDDLENELVIREVVAESRKKLNLYCVGTSKNAVDFLQNVKQHSNQSIKPDLILLELNMPQICGLEILKSLKAMPELKHVPVVLLASTTNRDHVLQIYEANAAGVLIKSSCPRTFKRQIETVITYWTDAVILP